MKQFKNKITGCIETVTNPKVLEQYEKHNEVYEEIKEKKNTSKSVPKETETE